MPVTILRGHCLDVLRSLPAESVQGVVTSPPYFQLRSYNTEPQVWGGDPSHEHEWGPEVLKRKGGVGQNRGATNPALSEYRAARDTDAQTVKTGSLCPCGAWRGELGQEPAPGLYVEHLVSVFRECWRVLKNDGVLLLNIADSYAGSGKGQNKDGSANPGGYQAKNRGTVTGGIGLHDRYHGERDLTSRPRWPSYAKPKDLLGIPWRVAFALQDEGWYLRGDYIWAKPACMTESVKDRCTRSHEYVFHLTKRRRYFWNQSAIASPLAEKTYTTFGTTARAYANNADGQVKTANWHRDVPVRKPKLDEDGEIAGANARSVWTIATAGFDGPHFAGFPPALAERMVLAVSRPGDTVLDPFLGAGTTALEADRHGRNCVGIELNPDYVALSESRIRQDAPLFAGVRVA